MLPSQAPLRRSGRARTSRVRDDFIDADFLQYVAPPDEPLAFAEEPLLAKSSPAVKTNSPKGSVQSIAYDKVEDRPIGRDFQATIPTLQNRPWKPTLSEAKFLPTAPLLKPDSPSGVSSAAANASFKAKYQATRDAQSRCKLLSAAIDELDEQIGRDAVQALNLGLLGAKLRVTWQPHEELLFCLGMCDKYRKFKYIRQCYMWSRSAHELNGYYHNVWKTRSTELADEFLTLREQHAGEAQMKVFVDKVRDQLTAIWDKKKMGDMPKLLKDMAAADVELEGIMLDASSLDDDLHSIYSGTSEACSDDTGSADKKAASKQRQRKRPAVMSIAGDTEQAGGAHADAHVPRQTASRAASPKVEPMPLPVMPIKGPQLQQVQVQMQENSSGSLQQPQQQSPSPQRPVPETAQHSKRRRQQPPLQLQQQQQLAQDTQLAAGAQSSTQLGSLEGWLQLPPMPTCPGPLEGTIDAAAVAAWKDRMDQYKLDVVLYMKTVRTLKDAAIAKHQHAIKQIQQQFTNLEAAAHGNVHKVVLDGERALQAVYGKAPVDKVHKQALVPAERVLQQQQPADLQGDTSELRHAVKHLLHAHSKRRKTHTSPRDQQVHHSDAALAAADNAASSQALPQHSERKQILPSPALQQSPPQQQQQHVVTDCIPSSQGPAHSGLQGQGVIAASASASEAADPAPTPAQHPDVVPPGHGAELTANCGGDGRTQSNLVLKRTEAAC